MKKYIAIKTIEFESPVRNGKIILSFLAVEH